MKWPSGRFFVKLPELAQQYGSLCHQSMTVIECSGQLHAPDSV